MPKPHPADCVIAEVDAMSDQQLKNSLLQLGEKIGPVTDTTRGVYRKKLISLKSSQIGQRKSGQIDVSSSTASNTGINVSSKGQDQQKLNQPESDLIPGDPLAVVTASVTAMSNESIRAGLKHFGRDPGPIVASTRSIYEKRLIKLKTPFEDWSIDNDDMEWEPIQMSDNV